MLYEAKKEGSSEFLKEKFMVIQELGMHTGRKKHKLTFVKYHRF